MSTAELYTKGARVWIPDPDEVWRGAVLKEDYKGQKQLAIEYEDEQDGTFEVKNEKVPPLRNPEILIGENDLTSLSYLHEPAVLYNLKVRFCDRNDIYTYCGIVLVAINPYEELPIYGNDIINAYYGQDMGAMDPHIYAVAEEAFKRLSRFDQNQSIIVSGESGAGKTVSAKYAMRYFAAIGGNSEDETQVEKKVLASNPIMEAIGNAKTIRNDNSSRFGKYLEIGFSRSNQITAANMRTYLLEKSRVVFQAPEERNYHIFYQLCACADDPEFKKFKLLSCDDFYYTFQGSSPTVNGIDDAEEMQNTREAFTLLGINEKQQMMIFQILSGVLHFGNVDFLEGDNDTSDIKKNDKSLTIMCELLGIDQEQMRKFLCNKKITTVGETLMKPLTVNQASFSRDALAKHIYSQLFNWIVSQINKTLSMSTGKQTKFIGVLDIYGFETFEINSFEQFCINYANEKLQQQFTLHVFKLEQEEYVREEIEWSFIDFYDNQPCIDLIESKLGILDLLDEECKMPKGADDTWCRKLYDKHLKNAHFEKPRMSNTAFIINHFADRVEYQSDGFLEKNRDTVLEEQLNILKASEFELVADLFADKKAPEPRKPRSGSSSKVQVRAGNPQPKGQKTHKKSVGSQFRESLTALMDTLFSTNPHYIRCIKPNDMKEAFVFEPKRAVQQLRACGVLETIRISAAGYPSRWSYPEFFQRYRVLGTKKDVVKKNNKQTCQNILEKLIQDPDKFQFGKTKIFFRAGQVAYLEKLRSDKLRYCGVMIQKHIRGWLCRKRYQKIKKMILLVQTYGRGLLARRRAVFLRCTMAATRIQKVWRGYKQRMAYQKIRNAVLTIQAYSRGLFGRRHYKEVLRESKARIIQSRIRGWLAKRRYRKVRRGIVLVQSHYRRRKARAMLKILKVEAKSVEHIKNINKGLENKIIELQQKLDEKKKEVSVLREDQLQLNELRNEMAKLRDSESDSKMQQHKISEYETIIAQLQEELKIEKEEKQDLKTEKLAMEKEHETVVQSLLEDKMKVKEELEKANQRIKEQEKENEDILKQKIEEANRSIKEEWDKERGHHQRLIKEHERLQQRYTNLQVEMEDRTSSHYGHRRTPSGLSEISIESEFPSSSTHGEGEGDDTVTGEGEEEKKQPSEGKEEVSAGDQGYGSERKKEKERKSSVENMQWKKSDSTPEIKVTDEEQPKTAPEKPARKRSSVDSGKERRKSSGSRQLSAEEKKDAEKVDLNLLMQLQTKVKELQKDKARLQAALEEGDHDDRGRSGSVLSDDAYDAIKMQELEVENNKLREELRKLRDAVSKMSNFEESIDVSGGGKNLAGKEFLDQFEAMADELERRRDECIQLRSLLVNKSRDTSQVAKENYEGDPDRLNEDGELAMAYKTQKDLLRMQEEQMEKMQKKTHHIERELRQQIEELKIDNERQQKLIGQSLTLTPEARIEATMQHEITRLTAENLDLREQIDKQLDYIHKLKKALKIYAKKLKNTEGADIMAELEKDIEPGHEDESSMAMVKHREREYMGMFEYRREEEALIIRNLIVDLKPKMALNLLPGLPAYILFMCIRHTDYINDDDKVKSLLTGAINGIKKVVKRNHEDLAVVSMWLANTCRLLHNLKQYSGEKALQTENTPKQNEHCLRNFDLSEYRQVLSDLAVFIYQNMIKNMQGEVQPMVVPGLLEHEAIAGLTGSKPTGMRGRTTSNAMELDRDEHYSLESMMRALNCFLKVFRQHALDPEITKQVVKQLYYFICAQSVNNLLLRKDMCNWSKGMQIRYNISHLEQWLRDQKLQDSGATVMLEPAIQASQLLQARKTDQDVESICDMCSKLTVPQIVKILNLYTPVDEFEERVPISFIRKVQAYLKKTRSEQSGNLLMDAKKVFPVTFPFNPSSLGLETIQLPESLGLNCLKRV